MEFFFHFLRACTFREEMWRMTYRALPRNLDRSAAKMAHSTAADRMIRQGSGTGRTLWNPAAHGTADYHTVTAPIEE